MKKFDIIMTDVVAPSDWTVEQMREHLRKAFTQTEVKAALVKEQNPERDYSLDEVRGGAIR